MPYIDGKRATIEEWREYIEAQNAPTTSDIDIPVEGEVKPKRARGSKQTDVATQVQAALGISGQAEEKSE